jgi:N-acetylneuraminate synthase
MRIGNRNIGIKYPPLIICELGINHGGSLAIAKKMVDLASTNGADVIKNQCHILDKEMILSAKKVKPTNINLSIYEVIKRNHMSFKNEIKLKRYVEKKGLIYLSTPFSIEAAKKLNSIGVKAFKIGSGECNNIPLLEEIVKFKKPIILSTGMNDLKSISESVKVLEKSKVKYALLHCKSEYPVKIEGLKLDFIKKLKKKFPKSEVGYSDHAIGIIPCISAMAKGASIIEKHFTDTKKRKGPDIICSMDPQELLFLKKAAETIHYSNGSDKKISLIEKKTARFAFSSVVSVKDIKKGEMLSLKNIWVKRPGTGDYLAKDLVLLIGKKAKKKIKKGQFIKEKDA